MSNQATANVMFAGKILRMLSRDLYCEDAKRLCNNLDRALRSGDKSTFIRLSGSLPQLVREDRPAWEIRELLQVVSLVRFPIWDLDDDAIVEAQRQRVQSLSMSLSTADREIWREMGLIFSDIIREAYGSLSLRDFRHGPGVVAETSDPLSKRAVCYLDRRIERRFGRYLPDTIVPAFRPAQSRTIVVPKDHKTRRVIASEPTWVQWCQQGVKGSLYNLIPKHRLFRGHVSFVDQELQRSTVRKKAVASIDLSDASDTIRVKHLLLLTEHDYAMREFLMDLRTPVTDWRGRQLPTIGLYPMGAAVCFPIETLIFSLCVLFYSKAETGRFPRTWGVFGDDIVIDDHLAGGLCSFLSRSGFQPNRDKTFIGGAFIESCGVMLYKGIDVTPIKVKKGRPGSPLDETNIAYREMADRCQHYPHLGECLQDAITCPELKTRKTRWNSDLHRLEVTTLFSVVNSIEGHPFGYPEALINGKCDIPSTQHRAVVGWRPLPS